MKHKLWKKRIAFFLVIAMMLSFMPQTWAGTEDAAAGTGSSATGEVSSPSALEWENSVAKISEDGSNGYVGTAIYLNGSTGDDNKDGLTSENAVKTFAKAAELATGKGVSTVYITGTVMVENQQTWGGDLTLVRETNFIDGALVTVSKAGELTLEDITIDGDLISLSRSTDRYQPANLFRVEGILNITDGAVIQNHRANAGGWQSDQYCAAVFIYGGTLNMSGGKICNNEGGNFGGGITAIYDQSRQQPAVINLTGGEISGNIAGQNGGGIYLYGNAELHMNRGTVTRNSAPNVGGGIYVGHDSKAEITAGYITNNEQTENSNFGGGGIYVESSQGSGEPGKLYLYNVEIRGNECTNPSAAGLGYDSTISACATSVLQINITDGAVIHDNFTTRAIVAYFDSSSATMEISPFMLGGAPYNWTDKEGRSYGTGGIEWGNVSGWKYACTDISEETNTVTGLNRVKTYINDNKAVVLGAAIGTNGEVYIGKSDGDVTLNIEKQWNESITTKPETVIIDLYATDGSGMTTKVGSLALSESNEWKTTVTNLPKLDSDGQEYTYTVSEPSTGYYSVVTVEEVDDNDGDDLTKVYVYKVTNNPAGSLKVSKTVSGSGADTLKEFTFTVTLSDDSTSGNYGDMDFEKGVATFTLKAGESKTAAGLPAGAQYAVTEADYSRDGYTTTSTGDAAGTIAADETLSVTFNNHREIPTGGLTVSKTVSGSGADTSKKFTFTVTLSDDSISGNYGDMDFDKGVTTFTLKHGERKDATGLPAGVEYTVTESNNSGYTVTVTGDKGTIAADQTATAAFTNYKGSSGGGGGSDTPQTGSLEVRKIVSGAGGDQEKAFIFTVTLDDNTISGQYGDMTFHKGVATVLLKHGESKKATGLPKDIGYEVTESGNSGYTVTVSGEKGVLVQGETAHVLFENHKDTTPGEEPDEPSTDYPNVPDESSSDNPPDADNSEDIEDNKPPTGSMDTDEPTTEVPLGEAPKTGDTAPILLLSGVLVAAACGVVLSRRKRNQ